MWRKSVVFFVLLTCGCTAKPDLDKARTVIETALDKWKNGGKPQQLTDQGIDVADPDWQAGTRLLDFQVKNLSVQPQQGPRAVVVLNLQDARGKKINKEVAYEVIMKDRTSIGRDAFHVGQ